jgi:TrmH family RNA methyltransferase
MLTTRSQRVREARALRRRAVRQHRGLFLAEGAQAVREALAKPDVLRELFVTPDAASRHADVIDAASVPVHLADDVALMSLSETVTPQGLVAVCRFLTVPLAEALRRVSRLIAVLVEVRDPGNAGTVIRCADAAGADAVIFAGESVDPYSGKCVRATAGSLFHLPVVIGDDVVGVIDSLRKRGMSILAADGAGPTDLDEAADTGLLDDPTAWLFGNEAHGLAEPAMKSADRAVRVPIHGQAESLNLATAAAVCLYASARAHRRAL